jgi:hypothetical protein
MDTAAIATTRSHVPRGGGGGSIRGSLPARLRALVALAFTLCAVPAAALVAFPASAAADNCPNAAFRTGPALHLPDCRAYEMVTPSYKNGGYVFPTLDTTGATEGEDVQLESLSGFANIRSNDSVPGGLYTSQRTEAGWTTTAMAPADTQFLISGVGGFNSLAGWSLDFHSMLWLLRGLSQPENRLDFYLTRTDGSSVDIGPALPPTAPAGPPEANKGGLATGIGVDGISAGASHMIFHLGANTAVQWPYGAPNALMEYVGTGNTEPLLVGVDGKGKFVNECPAAELGGRIPLQSNQKSSQNAMSIDGNTVFFTEQCKHELFARVDNGQQDAHTVAISEPTAADCPACDTSEGAIQPAYFYGASQDGSKVVFGTTQSLLSSDTSEQLYEYDFNAPAGEKIVKVSGGDSTVSSPTANVQGVLQVAQDGSHVYFVSTSVLTTTPNGRGQTAEPGGFNLYLFERDAQYPSGRTVFIATLPLSDATLWGAYRDIDPGLGECGNASPEVPRASNTTPDGRFLVLLSHAHLTADDTSAAGQLFEYDAQTGGIVRVSIGQNGYDDNGNTGFSGRVGVGESIDQNFCDPFDPKIASSVYVVGYNATSYTPTMSADGSEVFFQSSIGLTPQALNRVPIFSEKEDVFYAENIYEYHNGNVYLISDGQDISVKNGRSEVGLLGTDVSGRDVFLSTVDRLVGQDTDTNVDVYDARVDGGFPAPAVAPSCSADSCQGLLSAAPVLLSPGSELQAGGENVTPAVSESPAKSKPKSKSKKKSRAKTKRKKKKSRKAAHRSRANRKAGRS